MRRAPHVMYAHAIKRASPPKEVQQRHNSTMGLKKCLLQSALLATQRALGKLLQ
jgi:hypothetical protein